MSVDMFERRFIQEIKKLPPPPLGMKRNQQVWKENFPAFRSVLTGLCLVKRPTYSLPAFEQYFDTLKRTYCERHKTKAERFKPYFDGLLLEGMRERVEFWYQSFMAETYLYVCLVEAIEDKLKNGIVLYDARADLKLKVDIFVIMAGRVVAISLYTGRKQNRPAVEAKRELIEREQKINTSDSAHWQNQQLKTMRKFEVSMSPENMQLINGVRLPARSEINSLLIQVYDYFELGNNRFVF